MLKKDLRMAARHVCIMSMVVAKEESARSNIPVHIIGPVTRSIL